ncbi:HNH endonuclease [Ralstonia solanacearum]|uniref:HNH endonuclease n=1 Tax=Ralstonia solanacearum TaxID=305 RepID=UPI001FFD2041|nr:HNH endonuclease [Ralstonia solanacearum]
MFDRPSIRVSFAFHANIVLHDITFQKVSKCVFCKIETTNKPGPDRSEIDHAESKKNGGNNSENNGQNTCRTCNRQKGGKSTVEYLDWLKKLLGN